MLQPVVIASKNRGCNCEEQQQDYGESGLKFAIHGLGR